VTILRKKFSPPVEVAVRPRHIGEMSLIGYVLYGHHFAAIAGAGPLAIGGDAAGCCTEHSA
jgi:hypothetical protein